MKMPVIFVGHGSPENAVLDNLYTKSWKEMVKNIPKPKAIVCISAHWISTEKTKVTAIDNPKIIYDFYGFDHSLYEVKYPAKGDPKLAIKIENILKNHETSLDYKWGLDHGTWSVLVHMYPKADIPVLQISLDYDIDFREAFEIGKTLSVLRDEGVLIIGSGNVVHNLKVVDWDAQPYPWAVSFDNFVKENILSKNHDKLIKYKTNKFAELAHPTHDHYLPLIYSLGASNGDNPKFFNESIFAGSISMRCILWK